MPYGQIYWNHYGDSGLADTGFTEFSIAHDVRFGKTAGEDSHTAFSYVGQRRTAMADWEQIMFRDGRYPMNYQNVDDAVNNSDADGTTRQFWTHHNSPIVFGWPGTLNGSPHCDLYGANVDDMTTADLSATNGYPSQRDKNGTTEHSTSTDDLFQAQNRESCHWLSNAALSHDASNPFIGIHKDNPLKLTTTKKYNGYRLLLKRKRFFYNEKLVRLIHMHASDVTQANRQFIDTWGATMPLGSAPNSLIVDNMLDTDGLGQLFNMPQEFNKNTTSAIGAVPAAPAVTTDPADLNRYFTRQVPVPSNTNIATDLISNTNEEDWGMVGGVQTTTYPNRIADNPFTQAKYPNNAVSWASSFAVTDAVLKPDYNIREQRWTGSVYLRNITIKVNDSVLSAQNDINGQYVQVLSSEIYTDQSAIKATSSGVGNRTITFSNLYSGKTTIIERYISTDFKIKFLGDSTEYEITSVTNGSNEITLSSNLTASKTNSTFTLLIPRGSTDANYTWGNYKLTNFDGDTYDATSCALIENSGVPATFDLLFHNPVVNLGNGNAQTFHKIFNSAAFGTSGGKEKLPIRHPYWSNELSEGLHIRKDFSHLAYWERFFQPASCGQLMHISAKVDNPSTGNPNWQKCKWVKYWEDIHTNAFANVTSAYNASGFTNLKDSSLSLSHWDDKDKTANKNVFSFNVRQFHYYGVDKASGALWPSYQNNTAALSASYFSQNFASRYSNYSSEFTDAYGSGLSLGGWLDTCWFSGAAIKRDPSIRAHFNMSSRDGGASSALTNMILMMTESSTLDNPNQAQREAVSQAAMEKQLKHKSETTLYHPWTLAQYGFESDVLGWQGYLAGKESSNWAYHVFTIYDTNDILSSGSEIKVDLHQASSPWNSEYVDSFDNNQEESILLGYGASVKHLDNYQLFIVAK